MSAVAARLSIEGGARVGLCDAPPPFLESLGQLPTGAHVVPIQAGGLDVAVCFSPNQDGLEERIATLRPLLSAAGALWIAWPRKTPGVPLTLIEEHVRNVALAAGLAETRISVIDESWTGMRLVAV